MSTISIPKKIVKEIFEAGEKFAAAENALEDIIFVANPQFIKKMRALRSAHRNGRMGDWSKIKTKYDL